MDFTQTETIQRLFDDEGLRNILLNVEKYFDQMDLYVFENWIDGEIVDGPIVTKYWVELTLKYDQDKLPDPNGICLFLNQGTKINYKKDIEDVPVEIPLSQNDLQTNGKPRMQRKPVLLITFTIPRRLVDPDSVEEYALLDQDLELNPPSSDEDVIDMPDTDSDAANGTEQPEDDMNGLMGGAM